MGMRGMIALLGGLGGGYVEGKQQQVENDRQQSLLQLRQMQDAREQAAFDRTRQEQQAVQAAGQAPAPQVDQQGGQMPATMDNADIGQPGEQPIAPTTYAAGGQTGLSASQAVDASRAADTPEAQSARQASALAQFDPARAAQMRASAITEKNAQMEMANRTFDNGLNAAAGKGWDALMDYTNKSGASPAQHKFVPNEDGKTGQVMEVQPDGSLKPTGQVFPNTPEGAVTAAEMLSKTTPIQAKVQHYMQEAQLQRQEARDQMYGDAQTKHWEVMDRYYNGLIGTKDDANAIKAGALALKSTVEKMSPDDAAEFKDIKDKSTKLADMLTKAQLDAATNSTPFDPKDPKLAPLFEQKAAYERRAQQLLNNYRQGATSLGDPIGIRGGAGGGSPIQRARAQAAAAQADEAGSAPEREDGAVRIFVSQLQDPAMSPTQRTSLQREISRLPAPLQSRIAALASGKSAPAAAPAAGGAPAPAAQSPGLMSSIAGGLRSIDDAIGSSQKSMVPAAAPAAAAPAAPSIPRSAIPPPPPATVTKTVRDPSFGMVTKAVPNPDFQAWRAKFGDAYDQYQQQDKDAATSAARASYKPERAPYGGGR